jgi:hypothetical protein
MIGAIAKRITEDYGSALHIITSDDNADKQVRVLPPMAPRLLALA